MNHDKVERSQRRILSGGGQGSEEMGEPECLE